MLVLLPTPSGGRLEGGTARTVSSIPRCTRLDGPPPRLPPLGGGQNLRQRVCEGALSPTLPQVRGREGRAICKYKLSRKSPKCCARQLPRQFGGGGHIVSF